MTMHLEKPVTAGAVVADLRTVFGTGRTRSLQWRLGQLAAIERLCAEQEPAIAAALAEDLGRSAAEAWLGDITSTRGEAAYARKHLRKWMRRRRTGLPLAQLPGKGWVQYGPLGVVLIIGPWNYPVYLSLGPLVAAVAAGNCAVIKPSELAPATSALLAWLVPKYLDRDAIRVVEGDAQTTQELLAQGFDHALFTGGTEVGRKIMAAAAPTLTPVTLELGGKSPVIVAADADLDVTARRLAWVKMLNSGQTCIAPDYVLADRTIADELIGKIVDVMAQFRSAEPDPALPIVNRRQFDRLTALISGTRGTVVTGGRSDPGRLRIEPTVVADPAPDDAVMTEEIFGPILPVLRVDSVDEAIRFVNARPKPLALYVFTASQRRAKQIIDATPSGGAVINHIAMHCLVPQLPFGGVGASGMGAYHGRWGFETLSHRRAVLAKSAKPDPALLYPPYTDRALEIMRKLM
ncbi:aldehyde dehydrogenase family protein [Mycolicibacterium sp.]|uniref:aldehyde dehydrogenase family protein n=1 Tax=Mycolicibacterium sp. TaxID=2320850 RepID=UPI003D0CBFEB